MAPDINISIPIKMHNRFDFEVKDAITGEIKQKAYAENIILDQWWTRQMAGSGALANSSIHVGSGTGVLAHDRISLFNFLGAKGGSNEEYTYTPEEGWISVKKSAQWIETELQNTAWSEVGIGYDGGSTHLCTHALIKDINGNPVSINKGTTDIITVYASVYAYYPITEFDSGSIMIPHPNTGLPSKLFKWMLGLENTCITARYISSGARLRGYNVGEVSAGGGNFSGDPVTKKISYVCSRIAAASGNLQGGIRGITFGDASGVPDMFVRIPCTAYPYSTITGESVGTGDGNEKDFKTTFPFVKNDESFKLYKNGLEQVYNTDYTVDFGIPYETDGKLDKHMICIFLGHQHIYPGSGVGGATWEHDPDKEYSIYENPFYATYGIESIHHGYSKIYCGDNVDGPWTLISDKPTNSGTINIDAQYQNKRYWKAAVSGTIDGFNWDSLICSALISKKNIHFVNAPALGDTITADYRTETIAKDVNHVFDMSYEVTFQEKVV